MDTKTLELEVNLLHERVCSALSDTTRIMILYLLSERDMFVNEIAEALDTPQSTISRHLKVLRERNLVSTERQGTAVLYSIVDKRIIQSLDLMRAILNDQVRTQAAITNPVSELNQLSKEK
ncbi:MAG: ArsR family transcriptional regulator [Anaerolineaceae bacterium]|jgi:ArsR family transcriptional regulator|nr:MAG: ArsR family transcriptional regulator [Anaerolineaceae bacterium]